jgi:nucleoside-diphosphate-sugar epimerase
MTATHRIVLLGGAGLVGQNLVVRLLAAGYQHIQVVDKQAHNLQLLAHRHAEVDTMLADVATPGAWQEWVRNADTVVMLQAQIGGKDLGDFERNNVAATQCVLDTLREAADPYLIHISSSVVESVADDYYSTTKRQQEQLVLDSGMAGPVLRPTLMFGWFDRKHLGWLSRFMRLVPVFPIPGDGRYMRQPLYVGDFCQIIMRCVERRVTSGVYNITGFEQVDYIDIIRQIRRVTGARCLLLKLPYSLFHFLLALWAVFDRNPPFTTQQLAALCADDEFELIDWPALFQVTPTDFNAAIEETFTDSRYSHIKLDF